ncbi:hypothetical protein R3P38DRAFT_1636421 [Favolaschia claudopus]|uniref:Uncharacterized protein n=1 Tax=Favolaschia claudopus TaxID=2862362 RepID=A0AAW0DK36_9AGAR
MQAFSIPPVFILSCVSSNLLFTDSENACPSRSIRHTPTRYGSPSLRVPSCIQEYSKPPRPVPGLVLHLSPDDPSAFSLKNATCKSGVSRPRFPLSRTPLNPSRQLRITRRLLGRAVRVDRGFETIRQDIVSLNQWRLTMCYICISRISIPHQVLGCFLQEKNPLKTLLASTNPSSPVNFVRSNKSNTFLVDSRERLHNLPVSTCPSSPLTCYIGVSLCRSWSAVFAQMPVNSRHVCTSNCKTFQESPKLGRRPWKAQEKP